MEKLSKRKRLFILLSTYLVLLTAPKIYANTTSDNINYNSEYTTNNNQPYASLNERHIYILNQEEFNNIPNDNNIYILDERDSNDPDMSVLESYKYTEKEIKEIINILLKYESEYPSNWERTYKSLKNEWLFHNLGYYLNLEQIRTERVDLNNNDEEKYLSYNEIVNEIICAIKPKTRTLSK